MGFWKSIGNAFTHGGLGLAESAANAASQQKSVEEDAKQRKMKEWQAKLDPLKQQIGNLQGPQALALEDVNAGAVSGPLPEYERARQKALQQASANKSTNIAAIQRKAASLGATGSGAFIKQQQLAAESADQQAQDANADISAAESAKSRDMNFQSSESAKARNLSRESFNADQQFKFGLAKIDASSKLAGLELAFDDSERSRANEKFNMELAEYQKQHSGGLFGAGGFLGTGIGA